MLVALAAILLAVPSASAHTSVSDVEPADGATVTEPAELRVTFTDDVLELGATLTLRDADGANVELGELRFDGARAIVAGLPALPAGDYVATYRAVAGDGHPLEGTYGFAVDAPASEASPSPSASPSEAPISVPDPSPSPTAVDADEAATPAMPWWWFLGVAALLAAMAAFAVRARRQR